VNYTNEAIMGMDRVQLEQAVCELSARLLTSENNADADRKEILSLYRTLDEERGLREEAEAANSVSGRLVDAAKSLLGSAFVFGVLLVVTYANHVVQERHAQTQKCVLESHDINDAHKCATSAMDVTHE